MSYFIKCELCEMEIPADKCVFATCKKVIDGKEYVFCCLRCQQKFLEKREKKKSKSS
jgi:YHS domain-containing protein